MNKKVKNLERKAAPPTCGCKTFLEHWSKATKQQVPKQCCRKGCTNSVAIGAHVINCSNASKNIWRIVPLCNSCGSPANKDCFELNKDVKLPRAIKIKSSC